MNRFVKSSRGFALIRTIILSLAAAVLLLAAFYFGLSSISQVSIQEQEDSLRSAVTRSAAHFYAITGRYPESLDELTDSYPLYYDRSRFFISYQPIGENIMPEIFVAARGE